LKMEREGGIWTTSDLMGKKDKAESGKRKRTPGGIFFSLVKGKYATAGQKKQIFNPPKVKPKKGEEKAKVVHEPTYKSAIVLVPPPEHINQTDFIQTKRAAHDKAFSRWMPHINLVYGFVPDSAFGEAAEKITKELADFAPFELEFKNFSFFKHGQSCTVWLSPDTEDLSVLKTLQKRLESVYPQCNEQSAKSSEGFKPHMTIGQFNTEDECATTIKQWSEDPAWKPIKFVVKEVYLISRSDTAPFEI